MPTKEFEAHEWKKQRTTIKFTKGDGEKVKFTAEIPKRVSKHVKFETKG